MKTCVVEGCEGPAIKRGCCGKHYQAFRIAGTLPPLVGPRTKGKGKGIVFLREQLAYEGDECVEWPFGRYPKGYGQVKVGGKTTNASRVMCELAHGPAPFDGAVAAHSCDNPPCITKGHLSWKSSKGNSEDMVAHGRSLRGSASRNAIFTEEQVLAIVADPRKMVEIAPEYGTTVTHIGMIKTGRSWGWLTGISGPSQRRNRGARNGRATLNEQQVLAIVEDRRSNEDVASSYGVTPAAIRDIKAGRNWSWLTGIKRKAA